MHLAGAGILAYTDIVTRAAQRCSDSIVRWGPAAALAKGKLAGKASLPSGQAYNTHTVAGFDFGNGKAPHFSTITADGTIFYMVGGSAGNVFVAGGEGMTISAFNPDAGSFQIIGIGTDRNVAVPQMLCQPKWAWCQDTGIYRLGGWLGDVGALPTVNGGNAVAFTGYQPYMGQNLEACFKPEACGTLPAQGQFPIFGIVTRGANGAWDVRDGPDANGDGLPDWRNAWSPRELYDATVSGSDPLRVQLGDLLCPLGAVDVQGAQTRDCGFWVNELAVLPESHDVVVAFYGSGKVGVLHLDPPDASGRIRARIAAAYDLPDVPDPANPGKLLSPAPREVQADPSSHLGDERFGLEMDFVPGFIEFSYNPSGATLVDRLKPVSAPVLSGETHLPNSQVPTPFFLGYGSFAYDRHGNLWVPTDDIGYGLGMKVYTKTSSGRRITRSECLETVNGQPRPIQDYVATNPADPSTPPVWGKVCRPDYNILQPRLLGPTYGVEEDPASGDIALTDWAGGITTVVEADDPDGDGLNLTFRTGNFANPLAQEAGTTTVSGPCFNDRTQTCTAQSVLKEMAGPIDAAGRLWVAGQQFAPGQSHILDDLVDPKVCNPDPATGRCRVDDPEHHVLESDSPQLMRLHLDQWAYSLDLSRLMGREPRQLTVRSGQSTTLQAGLTTSAATTQSAGTIAVEDVDSSSPVRGCTDHNTMFGPLGRVDPVTGIANEHGSGLGTIELGDETDPDRDGVEAVPAGSSYEYRITVPKAGSYQLVVRATTRDPAVSKELDITFSGGGLGSPITRTVPITSAGAVPFSAMTDHTVSGLVTLPAGTYTLRLAAPNGGWELAWVTFTRQ